MSGQAMAAGQVRISNPSLGRRFYCLCAYEFAVMCCFYLPLSAAPAHSVQHGGSLGAGMLTTVLMAGTVVGELAAARLVAMLGRRLVSAAAMLMLALPAPLIFSSDLTLAVGASLLRGVGLGFILVAAGGLAVAIAPLARRSEALGIYGLAAGLPAIICVPLGLWVLEYGSAFAVASATVTGGLVALPLLSVFPANEERLSAESCQFPWRSQVWPALTLASGAVLAGAVITFLPLYAEEVGKSFVSTALFLHGLAAALSRLAAGRYGDRHGPLGLVFAGLLATVAGAVLLAALSGPVLITVGVATLGLGFGLLQSGSLSLMLARAPRGQADAVSAAWNIAYDAGLGAGGLGIALISIGLGFADTFLLLALATAALLAPLLRPSKLARPLGVASLPS